MAWTDINEEQAALVEEMMGEIRALHQAFYGKVFGNLQRIIADLEALKAKVTIVDGVDGEYYEVRHVYDNRLQDRATNLAGMNTILGELVALRDSIRAMEDAALAAPAGKSLFPGCGTPTEEEI